MEKTVECSGLVLFPWEHMRENGRLTHALVSVPDSLLVTRAEHMSNSRMGQFLHLLPYLVVYVVDRCVHVARTKHTHGCLSTTCLKYWQLHIYYGQRSNGILIHVLHSWTLLHLMCSWFPTASDQS